MTLGGLLIIIVVAIVANLYTKYKMGDLFDE
jgi:hypothetical protein